MASNISTENVRGFASSPWFVGILAIMELVLGFVLLSFPYLLGASAVWVAGIVLLVVGVLRLLQVFSRNASRLWSLFAGLVYIALGLFMVLYTGKSLAMLTLLVGIALLVGGLLRLVVAISMHGQVGTAWRYFNAIISLVLGGLVVWSWPGSSVWLIGTIIAIEMIFSGWTLLFLALAPKARMAENT